MLSSRLRQRFLNYEKPYSIFRIGSKNKTIFKTIDLGNDSKSLLKLKEKKTAEILKKSSKPLFILGQAAMCAEDAESIFNFSLSLIINIQKIINGMVLMFYKIFLVELVLLILGFLTKRMYYQTRL